MSHHFLKSSASVTLAACLSAGVVFGLAGCDSGSTTPSSSTPAADTHSEGDGHDHGHDHATTQPGALDSLKKSADEAVEGGTTAVKSMVDSAEKSVEEAGKAVTDKVAETTEKATEQAEALIARANSLMEQVKTAMTKKEFDVGETALAQLEKMMGSLPDTLQEQIKSLRSTFDKAVAAAKNVGETAEKLKDVKITNPLDVGK